MIRRKPTFTALAAAGALAASFGLGHLTTIHAQDTPLAPPTGEHGTPLPPAPRDGGPGPKHGPLDGPAGGPRGDRPPHPPRPEDDREPAKPVDPQAAPTAVKTASDALAGLTFGPVWTHTAPRGEQQVQSTLLFQGKEVARLEFDPADGSLLARGQHAPPPPAPAEPREKSTSGVRPQPPVPADAPDAPAAPGKNAAKAGDAPAPEAEAPAPANSAPVDPAKLAQVKGQLPEILKGLSVGQGAEVMPREGYWKVPLISGSRVVGELRLSGDGKQVIQDFAATRDAVRFAR